MGRRGTPDRWLSYRPLGERIPGTRFISFKVPLKEGMVRNLPEKERFTTQVLMESVPNLGLVIDLTNTDRYYNSKDFLGQGIRYEKIFCRGHEIPSQSVVDKFFSAVDKYLESCSAEDGDDKLIGVHCTHGLNRTGYLVCRSMRVKYWKYVERQIPVYMIRRMGFTPEDAISAFEKARGYPMEREEYLKSLKGNEESPKSPGSKMKDKSQSTQADSQSNEDSAFSDNVQANGFPDRGQGTWTPDAAELSPDMRTGSFSDFSRGNDFRRFPANGGRDGFGSYSRDMKPSLSWPSRNYRADFYNNFADSLRSFRASGHPYRWEFDPEERVSHTGGRMLSRRFYEQDFDGNQGMGPPRHYRARSSSSFFRDSRRHKNDWRDSHQFV